jgi:hypothetical protein
MLLILCFIQTKRRKIHHLSHAPKASDLQLNSKGKKKCSPFLLDDLGNAMDDLLLCNQVASLLDQAQESINILRPFVQDLVGVFGFGERDNSCRAINLGIDRLGDNQLGQELLAILVWQIQ